MPKASTAPAPRYRSAREDVAQLSASEILAVGEKDGRNPWETADAIDRWRDETLRYGYEVHNEAPERRGDWYWDNRAKLDNQTWEAKRALLVRASAEVAASIYPEPEQQRAAWQRIQAAGFDDEKLFEVNGENQEQALRDRAVLHRWQDTVDSGKFEGPPNPIVNQPVKQGGTTLATYDVRQADKDGTLEARIKIDPKSANEAVTDYLRGSTADNSGVSKIVRLPAITPERIESELAATVKAREAREAELAKPTRSGGFADSGYSSGPIETTRTQEQIDGDEPLFRLRVREALLSSPGASAVLVHEDIENTIKTDPEMSRKVGRVNLGEDIWKGILSGVLRTSYGVNDIAKLIKGDAEEGVYSKENAAVLSEALAAIDEVYPGSTRWMFEGGTIKKGIVQGAQAVGEMLPTMVGPQLLAKGALVAVGRSGIMRAGVNPGLFSSTAGIAPMAYGGSLFGTDAEIAAETDPERRAKLESGRRARAAWTAVSEVATESIFRGNQMFQRAVPSVRKELLRIGLQIPEEGIEEVIQKGIETNVIDPATIGRYDEAGLGEYLSVFVAGAVAGGGMQAARVATIPAAVRAERDALAAQQTPPAPPTAQAGPPPVPIAPAPEAQSEPEPETIEPAMPSEEAPAATSFDPAKVPVVEVPLSEISLSEDVPNFKEGADPDTGVVAGQELEGTYERLGTPPIVLWERLNGRKEVITGRHRLDLARRSGEESIPSQVVREADGFTQEQAMVFDAASNIRDSQGTVRDYADFFRNSPAITEDAAQQRGLLSRAKGRSGWHLGKSAADDLYALYRAEKITESRAVAIAQAAPNDAEAQRVGIRYAQAGKDPAFIVNVMRAAKLESGQRGETMDLFGTDDAAMQEMEKQAERASQFQKQIQDRITAAQSAAKRPEAAREMGIDVTDPKAVQAKIGELRSELARWQNWPLHRDLVAQVRGESAPAAKPESEGQLIPESEMPFNLAGETTTETTFTPPDTRSQEEIDRDSGQGLMFDDRQSTAPSRSGSRGAFSAQASRAGGSGIRDTGMPSGADPRSFSLPALVQLSKALGLDPTVNPKLKSALGRFTAKRVGGAAEPLAVQTRKGLFRDPDLAAEVLAHEIGHFIDYTAATEKGARFHQRLAPLSKGNWESIFPTLRAGYPANTPAKKAMAEQIRKEAIDLSSQWRGPFPLNDDYRNSAPELYADFLSALLNAPQFAKRVAPNVYEGFFNGLSQKPKVDAAYQEMQKLLSGDLVTDAILEKLDANQKAAMDKVIDLARPDRIPLKERTQEMILKGREQFINKWARVASTEGFRRSIQGDSFTSQLELNDGFAVRERSLFNDDIRQRVTDPLREAGVEDRHFARYLWLNRIIEDRRATGIWIENNPSDARQIMAWMAAEFGSSAAIQSEIASAPDASLYNVGARMIRELQDKGLDAERVAKVENKALLGGVLPDHLKGKAEKFITAFNVRGFMLNTEGIDVATAREGLRKTRDEVGAPKYAAIEKAAQELFAITQPITEAAINLGMYSRAVADEVLRPNAGNYIPFQVLEYFDGDVSAAIREGKGSTKALNDPLTALSLHTQALLGWMQRQKTSLILEQWAKAFSISMEDSGPMTKYGGRLGNDKQDVVLVWRDGRPHAVSFDEPGIAAAANFFDELNLVGAIAQAGGGIFARAFTKYAPGFIAYTNAIRDPKTSAERLGISATIRNYAKSAKIAKAYAKAAATGEALTPEIRELVKSGVLPPPDQSFFRLLTDTEIRDSINAGLSARDVVKGRTRTVHDTRFNRMVEAIDKPFVFLGALTESISKIAASKTLKEKGFSDSDVVKLARLVGIPNPGLGGTRMKTASAFSLFFRPIVQGWRAERTFLVNPKTRGGYMMRMALTEFLPTTLMFLAGAGILKTVLESLGLDPGDDLEEFYKSTSQYKKESGMVVPIAWWTPNGFEPVWGHKKDEVEANWIAWGLRIPRSEGGRLWGSLTWNALAETNENTKSPDSMRTWTRWAGSHLPGLNPAIDTFLKDVQLAQGINPLDSFRNQQIINRTDWDAGGMDRFRAALAWNLGQITGGFYRPETAADPNGLTDAQKTVRSIGPLRAAFTFDNYRDARQRAIDDAEKSKVAAKTKKALGSKATELIALGSSLERIGVSRNAAQDEKYDLFLEFNRKRWEGKSGLREKLRQAVADGDKAEVESITEYLEQEAERYLGYVRAVK